MEKTAPLAEAFKSAVAGFCKEYPSFIEAAKADLGQMFSASDYPSAEDIASRFGVDVRIMPIPNPEAFGEVLGFIQPPQAAALATATRHFNNEAMREARKDPYRRIRQTVGAMVERLTAYQGAKGTFNDSLVGNVIELAGLLPGLNLAADPVLDTLTAQMDEHLTYYSAKELRDDAAALALTLQHAEKILAGTDRAIDGIK
jgi:hypothetical protein